MYPGSVWTGPLCLRLCTVQCTLCTYCTLCTLHCSPVCPVIAIAIAVLCNRHRRAVYRHSLIGTGRRRRRVSNCVLFEL